MYPSRSDIISGTGSVSGNIIAVQFVTDSTVSVWTGMTGTVTGITYLGGFTVPGNFTTFTLATGTAIVHRGPQTSLIG